MSVSQSIPNDSLGREVPRELNMMQQIFRDDADNVQRVTGETYPNCSQGSEYPTSKTSTTIPPNQSQNTQTDSFQIELRNRSSDHYQAKDAIPQKLMETSPNYRVRTCEKLIGNTDLGMPNYEMTELIQMKEMHALLLHRECQSLANKVLELEGLLAQAAEHSQKKLVKDGCTWTEPCAEEYTSYHCSACNCKDQDDICKCSFGLSRLFLQWRLELQSFQRQRRPKFSG